MADISDIFAAVTDVCQWKKLNESSHDAPRVAADPAKIQQRHLDKTAIAEASH